MQQIAIFASGSGSNAKKIIEYFQNHPSIKIALIACNNAEAGVLNLAQQYNIPSIIFTKKEFNDPVFSQNLQVKNIDFIVLAGFLWLVPLHLIQSYPNKIINIHPALLPKYGGKGMYGHHVHEAVKAANEPISGMTIHLVNERFDEGAHLFQAACSLQETDDAVQIQKKVLNMEHQFFASVIESYIATLISAKVIA